MIAELFRYNCSTLFFVKPVVGVDWGILKEEFGLINSYLKDKAREDLEGNLLFALFKPIDFDYFELFLEQQSNLEHFLEDYDYKNGYVVIAYKIPEEYKEDFELFKHGKYSKFSDLLKNCYQKEVVAFLKPIPTFQWDVFNKSKKLRKELEEFLETTFEKGMELWSKPDEQKELLNIQQFIKPERDETISFTESN
jgi:hypothetical protein